MSGNGPSVSIVLVVMNDEAFVAETIESMLGQTYPNVRLHVQHGAAGTDRTLEIVKGYPVTWSSEQDTGYPDAANRGFPRTAGELVMFQAGDDPLKPDCLEVLVDAFARQPDAGFAYGDIEYIDARGRPFYRLNGRPYDLDELYWTNHVTTQSVVMRRDAFLDAGMFRTGIINADWDLYLRMGARRPSVYVPRLLASYRVHDASHSLTHLDKMAWSIRWVADTTLADPIVAAKLRRGPGRARAGSEITAALLYVLGGSRRKGAAAFGSALRAWPGAIATRRGLMALAALAIGPQGYARLRNRGRSRG